LKKSPILHPNFLGMLPYRKTEKKEAEQTQNEDKRILILHNDDFNTFDYVIESLQDVCGHSKEQAEQCAMITHFKGLCDVKRGTLKDLKQMYEVLSNRFLTVTID